MLRTCITCEVEKPHTSEFFYAHPRMRSGLLNRCIVCHQALARARGIKDPQKGKDRRRAYYARTAEKAKADAQAWYAGNSEKAREVRRKWAADNAPRKKATDRACYVQNAEKVRSRSKQWAADNPERVRAQSVERYAKNPDLYRAINRQAAARRRAKKLGAGGSHTRQEFLALLKAEGGCCRYCDTALTAATAEADHVHPISRGGSDGIENIAPSCAPCNRRKGTLPVDEFLAKRSVAA